MFIEYRPKLNALSTIWFCVCLHVCDMGCSFDDLVLFFRPFFSLRLHTNKHRSQEMLVQTMIDTSHTASKIIEIISLSLYLSVYGLWAHKYMCTCEYLRLCLWGQLQKLTCLVCNLIEFNIHEYIFVRRNLKQESFHHNIFSFIHFFYTQMMAKYYHYLLYAHPKVPAAYKNLICEVITGVYRIWN